MWRDIGVAIALLLVIEGIMPFLNPRGVKSALKLLIEMEDRNIRTLGLVLMVAGVILLYVIN